MRQAGLVEVHRWSKQTLVAANAILDDEFNSTPRNQGALAALIRAEQLLRDVLANILNKVFEFVLHAVHLLAHVQNYFNTGEIHAEVAGEVEYKLQSFDIFFSVVARALRGSRWFDEALAFIQSKSLRVNAVLLGNHADCIFF